MEEYICRICGLEQKSPTWDEEGSSSYNICHCCGVEFGIQDTPYDGVVEYREEWIQNGAQWSSPKMKPDGWDLEKQLKNIPEKWR